MKTTFKKIAFSVIGVAVAAVLVALFTDAHAEEKKERIARIQEGDKVILLHLDAIAVRLAEGGLEYQMFAEVENTKFAGVFGVLDLQCDAGEGVLILFSATSMKPVYKWEYNLTTGTETADQVAKVVCTEVPVGLDMPKPDAKKM